MSLELTIMMLAGAMVFGMVGLTGLVAYFEHVEKQYYLKRESRKKQVDLNMIETHQYYDAFKPTREGLIMLDREELAIIAEIYGLEVSPKASKNDIIDTILKHFE